MMAPNWDELTAEERKRQIGKLITGPHWSQLPLQIKERWLDQLLVCELSMVTHPGSDNRRQRSELP